MQEQISKQNIKDIVKLLKITKDGYKLLYDEVQQHFFIYGMDINNITLINTSDIDISGNKNLFEYSFNNNREITQIINFLLKEETINYNMVKSEYGDYSLNIDGIEEIPFYKKDFMPKNPDECLNLEYKNLQIPYKDFVALLKLDKLVYFDLKTNCLKMGKKDYKKEFETAKNIYIDFENKYSSKEIKKFISYCNLFKIREEYINIEIGRDAPLKVQIGGFYLYIAPKI